MNSLIINADDYGYSPDVSDAIIACFKNKMISNSTAMVNTTNLNYAVSLAKDFDLLDVIGLHLNLSEGVPLTKGISKDPFFCDASGLFNNSLNVQLCNRFFLPKNSVINCYDEIEAQICKYLEFGFSEMHIDSHRHTHFSYSILKIVINLAIKYNFKTIRIGRNLGQQNVIKKSYFKYINSLIKKRFLTTDYFGNIDDFQLFEGEDKSSEIMVHPVLYNGKIYDLKNKKHNILAPLFDYSESSNVNIISYKEFYDGKN